MEARIIERETSRGRERERERERESRGWRHVSMEEKLIQRLESTVARLESLSVGSQSRGIDLNASAASTDPSIIAFEDFLRNTSARFRGLRRRSDDRFRTLLMYLVKPFLFKSSFLSRSSKLSWYEYDDVEFFLHMLFTQKPDMVGLGEFFKSSYEKLMKAISMTEGRPSDFFNHLKAVAESLTALT